MNKIMPETHQILELPPSLLNNSILSLEDNTRATEITNLSGADYE